MNESLVILQTGGLLNRGSVLILSLCVLAVRRLHSASI